MPRSRARLIASIVPRWFKQLGPGVITGASDDDPSGIATYSQAGAQTGYSTLWVMLLATPMMSTVQLVSAHIGRVTGRGLAANMKKAYAPWLSWLIVALMLAANIINIGADIAAMGESVTLIVGGSSIIYAIILGIISIILQVFIPYHKYVVILKWLTLVLFSYVAVVFFVQVPWDSVLLNLVVPSLQLDASFFSIVIALLGTTISPYLFFWQASEEVEDEEDDPNQKPLEEAPEQARSAFSRIRIDTLIGVTLSNLVGMFIIIAAGATLHVHGITTVESASQAAQALRPIAGDFAFALFALGIIGTGMLALPVLAGSGAYAVGELKKITIGLEKKPHEAKGFYSIIALITLAGIFLIFIGVNPIKALYFAAIINGIVAVPVLVMMMLMGTNKKVMKEFTLARSTTMLGWITTAIMLAAAVGLFATL